MARSEAGDKAQAGNRASDGVTQSAPKNNEDTDFAADAKAVSEETGVPMMPGDPSEPVGPEDALGKGRKRGDYSGVMRLEAPHEAVPLPDADAGEPNRVMEPQKQRVQETGDAKGLKGGVDTYEQ